MIVITRDHKIGTLSLLGGVALFSTVEIASKMIGERVDPLTLNFIRFFVTGLLLTGMALPSLRNSEHPLTMRDYAVFLLNGLVGVTLALSLFHSAIVALDKAASAAVIFCINPVFVMIVARYINDEPWRTSRWVGTALGACGVLCFAFESGAFAWNSLGGLFLMVLSAFFFALSLCVSRRVVPRYGATALMGFSSLAGSLILLPLVLLQTHSQGIGGLVDAFWPVSYVTLFGTCMAYLFYYYGLSKTSAQRGAVIFFLKPVLASVLALIILGESINIYMLAGMVLILSAMALELPRQTQKPSSGAVSR